MSEERTGPPLQHNKAQQLGRVHAVQSGSQVNVEHLHLAFAAGHAERVVSVAPPLGRRDGRWPLRGRDALVASLWATMHAPADARVRVLHGLAGSGKTAIALEVAHRAMVRGIDVWWVDCSAEHGIVGGMLAVARQIGVPAEALRHGDAVDRVWHGLHAWTAPWLLVFDNADRPELLAGPAALADGTGWLRPPPGLGTVLVTSRDGDPQTWGTWCVMDRVGMLEPTDAARVLTDYAGEVGTPAAARTLADRLGGLPLALRMSGSYLADTAAVPWPEPNAVTTFDGYLAAIGATRRGDAERSIADQHRQIVNRAWDLSLDLLAERGLAQARPLLRVLSHLADAPVPYRLLLDPAVLASTAEFSGMTAAHLWRLLCGLSALGLVDLTTSAYRQAGSGEAMLAAVRVHPLVRHASRHDSDASATSFPAIAAGLLSRAARGGGLGAPHDPTAWPRWQAVTVHALHLATGLPDLLADGHRAHVEGAMAAAISAVRHLRARGLFAVAEPEYRLLHDIGERILPAEHPYLAQIRHELAFTLYYRGSLGEAERAFRVALEMRSRALGTTHPDTLQTQQALARVARSLGRYAEAETRLRSVYEAQRAALGADHPETLTSQHQLARALLSLGEVGRARAEFQRVLWRRRRALGPAHPDTLMTRHQLAAVAYRQGRHAAAERMGRAVGALRRETLGACHPDTLHSRHMVGLALAAQGHHDTAEAELREVLEARRRVFGERHPDVLTTRHYLAGVLAALCRTAEAVAEYRRVLAARRPLLGDDHPDTRLTGIRLRDLTGDESA